MALPPSREAAPGPSSPAPSLRCPGQGWAPAAWGGQESGHMSQGRNLGGCWDKGCFYWPGHPSSPLHMEKGATKEKQKQKKSQRGSEHCWRSGTCTDKAPCAGVVPRTCCPSNQLPMRPQTGRKKAALIPMLSPPLLNRMMRSSWLLLAPMANNLIAKPCLYLSGFQITWLGWASPTNGETTPPYAGTSKKEKKRSKSSKH